MNREMRIKSQVKGAKANKWFISHSKSTANGEINELLFGGNFWQLENSQISSENLNVYLL